MTLSPYDDLLLTKTWKNLRVTYYQKVGLQNTSQIVVEKSDEVS